MSLPAPAPDRTAVVTGASSGIGAAIARELASRRQQVTLVSRNAEKLTDLADEINASGVRADVLGAQRVGDDDAGRPRRRVAQRVGDAGLARRTRTRGSGAQLDRRDQRCASRRGQAGTEERRKRHRESGSDEGHRPFRAALPDGVSALRPGQRVDFGIVEGRRGEQALSIQVLDTPPSVSKAARKRPQEMAVICEDLIKMLDRMGNGYRHGRHPDPRSAERVAKMLRVVADELEL